MQPKGFLLVHVTMTLWRYPPRLVALATLAERNGAINIRSTLEVAPGFRTLLDLIMPDHPQTESSSSRLLPRSVLFELLPASFEPWGSSSWYPSRPPTPESLRAIEAGLGVTLPPLFLDITRACPSYGGWFGSIGNDTESPNHMLIINKAFREAGVPDRYVLLNHGHDGACDAWDTRLPPGPGGEFPIVSFRQETEGASIQETVIRARSFVEYIDAFVRTHAPRCPVKALRRRARQLLASHAGL
jgi:hypothetical protein